MSMCKASVDFKIRALRPLKQSLVVAEVQGADQV